MSRTSEPRIVHSISNVPRSPVEDRDDRLRSYLISMSIRTIAFIIGGLFLTVWPWMPGAWICLIAAVVLPYPAVVWANAQDKRGSTHEAEAVVPRMLEGPPAASTTAS